MPEQRPEDPNELARLAALTELASAEASIFGKLWELFKEWAAKLGRAVFGQRRTRSDTFGQPDPLGVLQTSQWFVSQLEPVLHEVEVVWTDGYADAHHAEPVTPDSQWGVKQAVQQARNRLVGVPDSVFASVRAATMKATTEGWSADDLGTRVNEILGEHNQANWRGRALTIARTEALSAYNGGKFAAFQSTARSLPDVKWEKVWLATHDHRTRYTHTRPGGGDLQRVPLMSRFVIGGAPMMYPGDPEGPPDETINCRCSMLLVEPGEQLDLSDRHMRSAQ